MSFLTILRYEDWSEAHFRRRVIIEQEEKESGSAPVSSRVQSAKVQDVPGHEGLHRLQPLEDGITDWYERGERSVETTCGKNGAGQAGTRRKEGTGRTEKNAALLRILARRVLCKQHRSGGVDVSKVLGPAEKALSRLRSDVCGRKR